MTTASLTGDELHGLLVEHRVLFPCHAGFATNFCLLDRGDGSPAMGPRGYLPIRLRDCTIGIETRDALDGHLSTRFAIEHVEGRDYSADSADLIAAGRTV